MHTAASITSQTMYINMMKIFLNQDTQSPTYIKSIIANQRRAFQCS